MDYKYIEQLIDRYFECNTTLEEEEILRTFFSQKEVPGNLAAYQELFLMEDVEGKVQLLDDDFDERVLRLTGQQELAVKAKVVSLSEKLRPLMRAAAIVAVILTLGNAAQVPYNNDADANIAEQAGVDMLGEPSIAHGDSMQVDTMRAGKPQAVADKQMVLESTDIK